MKKTILILVLMHCLSVAYAQKKAITDKGEEVILHNDGTWKYADDKAAEKNQPTAIPINEKKFTKGSASSFLLKSKILNVGIWLNPQKWSFKGAVKNQVAEYELKLKSGDMYGMMICENIEIPLETLKLAALENAREEAPDIEIIEEEIRNVNGLTVLFLQMNGTMHGVKFSYYAYYYSNAQGSVQLVTYTAQSLLKKYKEDAEELLNGFVEYK